MRKRSSSEVEWALILEGVVSSRLQAHNLHRQINRALALIEKSEKKDHFYQVAGDLIMEVPKQINQLEMELDATSLALTYLTQDDIKPRLPMYVKDKINDALETAQIAKKADLAPPLGGGPCRIVERIRNTVRDPKSQNYLVDEIMSGDGFEKGEEPRLYRRLVEKGPGDPIDRMNLSPHAQYRMDLRGVSVAEVRSAIKSFTKHLKVLKDKRDPKYQQYVQDAARGRLRWKDPNSGLFIAIAPDTPSSVDVVTVFWKGEDDPPPPAICRTASSRYNDNLSGYQTYVKNPTDPRTPEKQQVLPSPPWQGHQVQEGPSYYNTPDSDRVRYRRKAPIEDQGKDLPSSDVSQINTRNTVTGELLYDRDPNIHYDKTRATPVTHTHPKPSADLPLYEVSDNPGSAKVIPEGHDFQNRKAAVLAAIEDLVGSDVREKAGGVKFSMTRVDPKNNMWHFAAKGSKGEKYLVRVKATAKEDSKKISDADFRVSCTCPAWVWQGGEHHANQNDYLYGKLRGSGSTPVVKDPMRRNGTCKHVWAVLSHMKRKNFVLR